MSNSTMLENRPNEVYTPNWDSFFLKSKNETRRIRFDEVVYLEQNLRKLVIHLQKEEYSLYGKISEFMEKLPAGFYKCNRSYIINLRNVVGMKELTVYFTGENIPLYIGRKSFSEARKAFEKYIENYAFKI